jgi:hypothetical protein
LQAELKSLRYTPGETQTKRLCQLRASRRYGPYLKLSKRGKPSIDRAAVKVREKLDGKFVVHSNDDTLSAEDMALGYKQLQRVEEAWRSLKTDFPPPRSTKLLASTGLDGNFGFHAGGYIMTCNRPSICSCSGVGALF